MSRPLDHEAPEKLHCWIESGQPRRWVEAHDGQWSHDDWLALLDNLSDAGYGPLPPDAVGLALEEARRRWWNLRRWQQSGQPRRWVEDHGGQWSHREWLELLAALRQSEFWPLDPEAVGRVVEAAKTERANLGRWLASGEAREWVAAHQARWDHAEWLALLESLKEAGYWPVQPEAVGLALRGLQREWWNLRRWQDSGLARRWLESRRGQWGHDDFRALVRALSQSEFWPVDLGALRRLLEELGAEAASGGGPGAGAPTAPGASRAPHSPRVWVSSRSLCSAAPGSNKWWPSCKRLQEVEGGTGLPAAASGPSRLWLRWNAEAVPVGEPVLRGEWSQQLPQLLCVLAQGVEPEGVLSGRDDDRHPLVDRPHLVGLPGLDPAGLGRLAALLPALPQLPQPDHAEWMVVLGGGHRRRGRAAAPEWG